jgi:hypothetical protein
VGAEGFRFKYLHLEFGGMSVLLLFTTFLTRVWNDLVGVLRYGLELVILYEFFHFGFVLCCGYNY